MVQLAYDGAFVYAEVNADLIHWLVEEDGGLTMLRRATQQWDSPTHILYIEIMFCLGFGDIWEHIKSDRIDLIKGHTQAKTTPRLVPRTLYGESDWQFLVHISKDVHLWLTGL